MTPAPSLELLHAIEAAAARAWPASETVTRYAWVLRCGRGRSRRLNSAQTLAFDGAVDVDAAIRSVESWYAARHLPPCFRLTDAVAPHALDSILERRGYAKITPTSVMLAANLPSSPAGLLKTTLETDIDTDLLDALCDPSWSTKVRDQRGELFGRIVPPHRFALIRIDGTPVAAGMTVVDGQLAGLFTMRTHPTHRGHGFARVIAHRLIDWAREQGAAQLYLQVEDDNAPALHLYRQLGFERVYGYHYRERA